MFLLKSQYGTGCRGPYNALTLPMGKQTTRKHLSGRKNVFPLNVRVYFSSCNKLHLSDVVSDSFIVFVHILTNLQDRITCNGSHRLLG